MPAPETCAEKPESVPDAVQALRDQIAAFREKT